MNDNILVTPQTRGDGALTVVVKDCIDVAGLPTRVGSGCFDDMAPSSQDADVVASLLIKGCTVVGKANMHELAFGITGVNARYGTPANPRFPDHIPGGSSSGSAAAVAEGLCRFALGSDTGGSIRVPATCCGVYGLKPSFGRISRGGCLPAQSSLDCIGPLAGSLADIELAMSCIDSGFHSLSAPQNIVLGVVDVKCDDLIAAAIDGYLEASGVKRVEIRLSELHNAFRAGIEIMADECWQSFHDLIEDPRMGDDVRRRLLAASKITPEQVLHGEAVRIAFGAQVNAALERVDALVLPTLPAVPPLRDAIDPDPAKVLDLTRLARPFNLSGHPALSIPLTVAENVPVALQLVGRVGGDEALCAVAKGLEQAWREARSHD